MSQNRRWRQFIKTIKDFQAFLRAQKNKMNPNVPSLSTFAISQRNVLIKKMPPALRKKLGDIRVFSAMATFTADAELRNITEENLLQMFQMDETLVNVFDRFEEVIQKHYIPQFKEFLSKITVSCFSAGGWDNQLMWSHYANSYSGICIEYDFDTVNEGTGFVFPVNYSSERPTITLSDLGFSIMENGTLKQGKDGVDVKTILSYLLVKNKCWEYEQEWRIINIGEKDTPIFIDMPKIKSITLGLHMNNICKHLLFDICKDKGIPCYKLILDTGNFTLRREPIDLGNPVYTMDEMISYIQYICEHITGINKRLESLDEKKVFDSEKHFFDAALFISILVQVNDMLFYTYCLKNMVNSFMQYADDTVAEDTYIKLSESAQVIDEIINQFGFQQLDVIEGIKNMETAGIVSSDLYKKAEVLLQDNKILQEKANAITWDSRINASVVKNKL